MLGTLSLGPSCALDSPTGGRPGAHGTQSPQVVQVALPLHGTADGLNVPSGLQLQTFSDADHLHSLKLPSGLKLQTFSDDEDDEVVEEGTSTTSFSLSQSGAFTVEDFQLRATTGLMALGDEGAAADHRARPTELGFGAMALPIKCLRDLQMIGELGSGASGTVYKARHVGTGTAVAIKSVTILHREKREQILSELRLMRKNTDGARWLVHMHEAFYENGRVYTVLEYMDGGDLEGLVARHAPSGGLRDERELTRIGRGIAQGLAYLHSALHQVHRDLKPANVLLSRLGAVKIADFGLSKALDSTLAFATTFVGTTCYMSPERLNGDAYSYPADVWPLGLILLELATGTYPYEQSRSYFALFMAIMEGEPPALPADCGLSQSFTEALVRCLSKDPTRRPSAKELVSLWQAPALSTTIAARRRERRRERRPQGTSRQSAGYERPQARAAAAVETPGRAAGYPDRGVMSTMQPLPTATWGLRCAAAEPDVGCEVGCADGCEADGRVEGYGEGCEEGYEVGYAEGDEAGYAAGYAEDYAEEMQRMVAERTARTARLFAQLDRLSAVCLASKATGWHPSCVEPRTPPHAAPVRSRVASGWPQLQGEQPPPFVLQSATAEASTATFGVAKR